MSELKKEGTGGKEKEENGWLWALDSDKEAQTLSNLFGTKPALLVRDLARIVGKDYDAPTRL